MASRILRAVVFATAISISAYGEDASGGANMLGRQSQNEGILVVPAPGVIKVDGKLDDWDCSGRIWCFADKGIRNRYSAKVACMWDTEALYVAIDWRDPTPMHNMIDPQFNPSFGWKGDSVQLRIHTGEQTYWLTAWHFTGKKMPVLHVARWKNPQNMRPGMEDMLLTAEPGETDLGEGVALAYATSDDGGGYLQEMRIPWTLLRVAPEKVQAGAMIRIGMEFLWGDPTGKTWPIHRYADNMEPGVTSREFYWMNWKSWGQAKLTDENGVPERKYVSAGEKIQGTIPVRVEIPKEAARFTLVIEDEDGKRVRNLGGDLDPADYTVDENDGARVVEVMWDGLMDIRRHGQGRGAQYKAITAEPGVYKVRGLWHAGLGAEYEMCFYNPGTPPWKTADTTGAWGADHSHPYRVARSGDSMIVCWPGAEGGHGVIAVNPEGRKIWGAKIAAVHLAANKDYVFALSGSHRGEPETLYRLQADGKYKPFVLDGEERPFALGMDTILGVEKAAKVTGMAATDEMLALATADGKLVLLDPTSAKPAKTLDVADVVALAFGPKGNLYALVGQDAPKVNAVNLGNGSLTLVATPGVEKATDMAVDNAGNLLVADMGADSQVKAFTPDGKPAYACGKKGGRPLRGTFDEQAMIRVTSVAADARGDVWAVESWHAPRRVSVWGKDGKLVRDYVGNTGYAGSGSYLHDQDPTLGYVGPVEMKLDKENRAWKVTQITWEPYPEKGEGFGFNGAARRFRSQASGKNREYMFRSQRYAAYMVYMARESGWKPVAAVGLWRNLANLAANGEAQKALRESFADVHGNDLVFWNDIDKDGIVERGECEFLKAKKVKGKRGKNKATQYSEPMRIRGGGIQPEDLVFYNSGIWRFEPVAFDDEGAPRYGPEGLKRIPADDTGNVVGVPEDEVVICHSHVGYAGPTALTGYDMEDGSEKWYYPNPYPGVHGSHRAPMPVPGVLIGPLSILGVVEASEDAGNVFLMRGNLGQNFLLTTDGLFVGAMMQDGRLPYQNLPATEEQLIGMPMESFSEGGEPFNGWFGRQDDGAVRLSSGMARQACMILRVKGLETIHRFDGPVLDVTEEDLAEAAKANAERAAAAAGPARAKIAKKSGFRIDAVRNDWGGVKSLAIKRSGSPEQADIGLAWDDKNLYVYVDARDPSPWKNTGQDPTQLFKTGDAVDIQLCVDPKLMDADKRKKPGASDVRLLLAPFGDKKDEATAVLIKPVAPDASEKLKTRYHSPILDYTFDRVEVLDNVTSKVKVMGGNRYALEAAIPLSVLGLSPKSDMTIRGDVGFISSDPEGMINTARTYWSNKNTNLVNDLPSEAMLYPETWGYLTFE